MSEKQNISVLPGFSSNKAAEEFMGRHPSLREFYVNLTEQLRQILIDFFTNRYGSKITYDTVFKKLFDPYTHSDRLEAVLSAILERPLKILQVLARADCYASDLILRQYAKERAENTKAFNFEKLHKVYCIVLMENSPSEFHEVHCYVHRRRSYFDSGIFPDNPGLHEDVFVCLDSFRSVVHNITKDSRELDAWLWLLCARDAGEVDAFVKAFPQFIPIYRELFDFMRNPKELMQMLSEALYIMDKNTERLMVTQLQEEVAAARAERDKAAAKADAMVAELQKLRAYALAHGYQQEAELT